jgi:hypothetical protein
MLHTRNATSAQSSAFRWLVATSTMLVLMIAFAPLNSFAQGTYTQSYLPSAYGTYAFVGNTILVGQTAPASLAGLCGTTQEPLNTTGTVAGVSLPPLVSGGAVNTAVSDATQQAQAEANSAAISLLGGLITAQEITAFSTTTMDNSGNFQVSAAGSNFNNLVILGRPYSSTEPPNTRINLPLLGYVVLNEQTSSIGSLNATMTVNMMHVYVTVGNLLGLQVGTQIIVSSATSGMYNVFAPGIISGDSYGTQVSGGLLASSPSASEVLPCLGTGGVVETNTQVGLNLPSILTSGTLTDTVESNLTPTFSSGENTSTIEGLNLLNGLVTASLLQAVVNGSVDQNLDITLNGTDTYVDISVAGHPEITDNIPLNTSVNLAGLGTLYLKRVIYGYFPVPSVEVRSLELVINQTNIYGLPIGLDVIVGDALITILAFPQLG